MGQRWPYFLVALLLLQAVASPGGAAAERRDKRVSDREVIVVAPDRGPGPVPLVVALHGCDQTAAGFLSASGLESLVDVYGFALALPQARPAGGNPLGCWPWWQPENQRRDGPDPAHIAAVTRSMDIDVDSERVYVLGLSSGGAMAAILGAVYPDVFAAVGIHSGLGFAAAGNASCAVKALGDAPDDAEARGRLAYLHQTVHRVVPTMLVHGREDDVVDPRHAAGLVREIAQRNDFIDDGRDNDSFDSDPDEAFEESGPCRAEDPGDCHTWTSERYEDNDGNVMLTNILVDELGHAWSGGRAGAGYTDPRGPDAGELFWAFFQQQVLDPDAVAAADPHRCLDLWATPWWHYWWAGTMTFSEFACDMSPWSVVWRHRIDGVSGPGRCP